MPLRHIAAAVIILVMALLLIGAVYRGVKYSRDFKEFLSRYGFDQLTELEKLRAFVETFIPFREIGEQLTFVREKSITILEAYSASVQEIHFIRLAVWRKRITTRSADLTNSFFLFPCSLEIASPLVVHFQPNLNLPFPINHLYGLTKRLNQSAAGIASIQFGPSGETELHHVPAPQLDSMMVYAPNGIDPQSVLRPFDIEFLSGCVQNGFLSVTFMQGWALLETLYLTPENFQGWRRVTDPFTQMEYVKRYLKEQS